MSFATAVLAAAMLACNFPNLPIAEQPAKVLNVAVVPSSVSGSFTLEVTYEAGIYPDRIYCNYATPDFATRGIGQIKIDRVQIERDKPVTLTESLPFSVTQTDGKTKPGTYVAGCGAEGGDTLTTTFTVVGEKEQAGSFSKVLNVAVTPPYGSGNFTLEVTYESIFSTIDDRNPAPINCNYVSPDGATMPVDEIFPTYSSVPTSRIEELAFSVTQADGKTKPGTYVASCGTEGGDTLTTTFTVVEETLSSVTPTAESIQPIQVKGTGQKTTSNWDFQPNYCTTTADLVLTVTENGWGMLEITGDAFYDHMNCLAGIGWEKWLVKGVPNSENETVSFMSCSYGDTDINQFNAQGIISYSGGVLSGEVTCLGKSGSEAGRVVTIIKTP